MVLFHAKHLQWLPAHQQEAILDTKHAKTEAHDITRKLRRHQQLVVSSKV